MCNSQTMPHVAGDTSAHQEPASWRGQLMCSDTDRSTSVLATQCLQDQRDPPLSQSSSCHKILSHKAAIVTRLQIVTKPCCTGTWQVLLSSCRCRVGPTAHKLAGCKSEAKDWLFLPCMLHAVVCMQGHASPVNYLCDVVCLSGPRLVPQHRRQQRAAWLQPPTGRLLSNPRRVQ